MRARAEEERGLTRPEGVLGGGPFQDLLTHRTRSPSEHYVKQFRGLGAWERIDYVRDVKAQPPSAHAARARTRLTSSRGSADPRRVTVGERGERARRLGHTE